MPSWRGFQKDLPRRCSCFDSVEKSLRAYLSEAGQVTVVGVGNTLRQDDCVGVAIVRALRKTGLPDIQLIEDEAIPEDRIPEIEAFKPTHVIIIDAKQLGMSPGSTVFKTSFETAQQPIATHALPLRLFAEYLAECPMQSRSSFDRAFRCRLRRRDDS